MDNRFKMRISRMFRGSFSSCRTRNISDVIEKAVFVPQKHKNFHVIEPLPPKTRPFSSICKPKCPESTTQIINNSIIPRQKVSDRYPPLISANTSRRRTSRNNIFPCDPFYNEVGSKEKKKSVKNSKKKKNKTHLKKSYYSKRDMSSSLFSSSSQDSAYFGGSYWFSSEEEEEEEEEEVKREDDESDTLFSSRSLSSDSSGSLRRRLSRRKKYGSGRRKAASKSTQMGVLPLLDGKVKDSFAVVKSSSDPYSDFRTSMVEMIVEKQIFSAKDLEHLLQCFLSLNSFNHHRIIVEVFTEIWEALFSNWC